MSLFFSFSSYTRAQREVGGCQLLPACVLAMCAVLVLCICSSDLFALLRVLRLLYPCLHLILEPLRRLDSTLGVSRYTAAFRHTHLAIALAKVIVLTCVGGREGGASGEWRVVSGEW